MLLISGFIGKIYIRELKYYLMNNKGVFYEN